MSPRPFRRPFRCLTLSLLLLGTAGAAPAGQAPADASVVVAEAVRAMANCGDACRNEKGLAAEVWNLRKRVASKDELAAMAVLVEQGEESCLCGKTAPTATEIEKQGMLLAEAVLLYHLAGDPDGVRYNTQRLRNVVAKVAGQPDEPLLMELLVRVLALSGGEHRADTTDYGAIAVRELAGIQPERMRIGVLIGAAGSSAVPLPARLKMLAEAQQSLHATPPTADLEPLEVRLAVELARAGVDPAASLARLTPQARSRAESAIQRSRAAAPKAASPADLSPPESAARDIARRLSTGDTAALASSLQSVAPDLRVWTAGKVGEWTSLPGAEAIRASSTLPAGPACVAFLCGVARSMTAGSDRAIYEDILIVRALP